jgi:hypothetical protein
MESWEHKGGRMLDVGIMLGLLEATKQGLRQRIESLALLRKHEGDNAEPTCENCEFSRSPHTSTDHCYMFEKKPEDVPPEVSPCGQWKCRRYCQ